MPTYQGGQSMPALGTPGYGGSSNQPVNNPSVNPASQTLYLNGMTATPNANITQAQYQSAVGAGWSPTPVTKTINAKELGTGTPTINVSSASSAPSTAFNYGDAVRGNIATGADLTTNLYQPSTISVQESPKVKTMSEMVAEITGLYKEKPSISESYNRAQQESGRMQAQQRVNQTQNQINAVTTKLNQDLLQLRGTNAVEGVNEAVYGGQQSTINREATIRLLPLQGQLAADQGNLKMAEESFDTLFKVYSEDANSKVEQYNRTVDIARDLFTTQENRIIDARKEANKQASDRLQPLIDQQGAYTKMAVQAGQTGIAQQISSLRPPVIGSKDYESQFAKYQDGLSKLIGGIQDPTMKLDIAMKQAELDYKRKQTQLLGEPTATETKATTEAIKEAKSSLPIMQDKVKAVDTLSTHSGLSSRVGTGILSRTPKGVVGTIGKALTGVGALELPFDAYAKLSGSGQDFAGGVHKLTSGLSLDTLIEAKARGATFGALSDSELRILSSAATSLADWEVKDSKGVPQGIWNIDEKSFKRELNTIKDLTNRAILLKQGTLVGDDEDALLDNLFNPSNQPVAPSNYY